MLYHFMFDLRCKYARSRNVVMLTILTAGAIIFGSLAVFGFTAAARMALNLPIPT